MESAARQDPPETLHFGTLEAHRHGEAEPGLDTAGIVASLIGMLT